jgi:hypothetical protein
MVGRRIRLGTIFRSIGGSYSEVNGTVHCPMATGKKKKTLRREPAASYGARADAIAAKRDRQLAEIELIRRGRGKLSGLPRKAYTLLTRGWAKATWQSREEILKAAAWLLYLDRLRDILSGM